MKPIIKIEVEGGCVTSVTCNQEIEVEVFVRDFDNIDGGDQDPLEYYDLTEENFQYTLW